MVHIVKNALFIGMPGVGKGLAAQAAALWGYTVISGGDLIREEGARRKLNIQDPAVQAQLGLDLRAERGPAAIAQMALEKAKAAVSEDKDVIFDGGRNVEELMLYREHIEVSVVSFFMEEKLRHKFLMNRPGREITLEQALERDRGEREDKDIGRLMTYTDYAINNTGYVPEFERQLLTMFALSPSGNEGTVARLVEAEAQLRVKV